MCNSVREWRRERVTHPVGRSRRRGLEGVRGVGEACLARETGDGVVAGRVDVGVAGRENRAANEVLRCGVGRVGKVTVNACEKLDGACSVLGRGKELVGHLVGEI